MERIINTENLTVEDVLAIGVDAVNDRLPKPLLLQMARRYVVRELDQRTRRAALAKERAALKQANLATGESLDAVMLSASLAAAQKAAMNWQPILGVGFVIPGKGISTTWGEAVIDEHLARADWLENMATGTLRTAVTHRRAVYELGDRGVDTLAELVRTRG